MPRFICLVHVDPQRFVGITEAEDRELQIDSYEGDQRLLRSGHLIAAGPLGEPEGATLIRIRDGKLSMTDGPYVETKEHLGGFVLIEAKDRAEAIELLGDAAIAKYGTLEIREHWALQPPGKE
jgi:hypothetical protein